MDESRDLAREAWAAKKRKGLEDIERRLADWRWKNYLLVGSPRGALAPYRVSHQMLMQSALKSGPASTSRYTVHDFAQWVYRLYLPPPDETTLTEGKKAEVGIDEKRRVYQVHQKHGWALDYCGLHQSDAKALLISGLRFDGQPFKARPDYVFRNVASGAVVIVEIKYSDREIPRDGWPNLRAQLWAYANIDQIVSKTDDISLIGEVWGPAEYDALQRGKFIRPRRIWRWHSRDSEFFTQNEILFRAYGGQVVRP